MARRATAEKRTGQQSNPLVRYFSQTRGELRKVTWPSREESWRLTTIVLAITIFMSIFFWVFDSIFSQSLEFLLRQIIV